MVRIFMNQTLGLPKREVYLFVGDGHCPPTSDGPVINCPTSETETNVFYLGISTSL